MKAFILFLLMIPLSAFSSHFEKSMNAVVRDGKKAKISKVELKDLTSSDSFEGEFFKIVKGKSNEAISFDEEEEILLKAATVYHHLSIARNYFIEKLNSDYVRSIPQMTIRIEHTNQFSELGHFAHDNMDPQYNNALTIPEGSGLAGRGIQPWGMEIWFRPSKRVHIDDLKVNALSQKEFQGLLSKFRNQVHMQSLQRFFSQVVISLTNPQSNIKPLSSDSLFRTAGSSVMLEAGFKFIEPITNVLTRKWYSLETSLVPEIIYHEYAHAALSDHLKLTESTSIIEGMADFFAGQIADSPKLAMHIKKYNTYNGKNAKKKQQYRIEFETTQYANTDFVFGLLWELKTILGESDSAFFMYNLRKNISTYSSIRGGLVEGLIQTCEESCEMPFVDKIRILKALNLKGI